MGHWTIVCILVCKIMVLFSGESCVPQDNEVCFDFGVSLVRRCHVATKPVTQKLFFMSSGCSATCSSTLHGVPKSVSGWLNEGCFETVNNFPLLSDDIKGLCDYLKKMT